VATIDVKFVAGYISVPKTDALEYTTVDPSDKFRVLVDAEQFQKIIAMKSERVDVR
jgi:hypothetical protein